MGGSKYHSRKVTIDGIRFDSQREASRWQQLKLLQKAGRISELERQVKYVLVPSQRDESGKVIEKQLAYVADFRYKQGGRTVVEDSKGYRTAEYRIKRKLMLYIHGIRIQEV